MSHTHLSPLLKAKDEVDPMVQSLRDVVTLQRFPILVHKVVRV